MLLCCSLINAQAPKTITVWTDRAIYNPGESGKLFIAIYNSQNNAVTVIMVSVTFENWRAFSNGVWEGNKTIDVNKALASGETCLIETSFTVPTDGRAVTTLVEIDAYTKEAGVLTLPYAEEFRIPVSEASSTYMAQIVSILTIQVVLTIICTVIIAAIIFLSVRKYKTELPEEAEKSGS